MSNLSQFLSTGSYKIISADQGTIDTTTTGVKITSAPNNRQKVILHVYSSSGSTPDPTVVYSFGGRNVYTQTESLPAAGATMVGGRGETLTVNVTVQGQRQITYFLQIVEVD